MFNIDPGQEYAAVVEFAPFQKISKKKLKKKDAKAGSIEEGTALPYLKKNSDIISRINIKLKFIYIMDRLIIYFQLRRGD